MKTLLQPIRLLTVVATVACAAFIGSTSQAGVISGNATNNAILADFSTPTNVVLRIEANNFTLNQYFQMGFRTQTPNFNIANLMFSLDDGASYSVFDTGSVLGVNNAYTYTAVVGATGPSTVDRVFVKYTIPTISGAALGDVIDFELRANTDNSTSGGLLSAEFGNDHGVYSRDHTNTAVPEPTSFVIASIGLGMGGIARLRKRFAKKA